MNFVRGMFERCTIHLAAVMLLMFWTGVAQAEETVRVFPQLGHTNMITSIAISPNGRYVLSGSYDNSIKLWDLHSGREIRTLNGHLSMITSVAFSPDGRYILSSGGSVLKLWDLETGREIKTIKGGRSGFQKVAFSPDGSYILSSGENVLKLWNIKTGGEIKAINVETFGSENIAFSPDGRYVLSGSGYILTLMEIDTGKKIRTFETERQSGGVQSIAFSPDGRHALSGGNTGFIQLWDINTGKVIRTLTGYSGSIHSLAFSPDGRHALSGDMGYGVKLWDVNTGNELVTFGGHSAAVKSVVFSPDGKYALSGSADKTLKLWDIKKYREVRSFQPKVSNTAIAFSPDGKLAIFGDTDMTLKLWDIVTGKVIKTFKGSSDYVISIIFSPDSRFVLSVHHNGTLELWDINSGEKVRSLVGSGSVISVAFSPDGRFALSGGSPDDTGGCRLILWDIETGSKIRTFKGHSQMVMFVAFSPDGKYALSAGNTVKLWDINNSKEIWEIDLQGHQLFFFTATFSSDGKYVLSGGWDNTIKMWDIETGTEVRTFNKGHSEGLLSVAISRDGKYAMSGSWDNTLKLWDINTGKEIRTFQGSSGLNGTITFTPDGRHVWTVGTDNTIRHWDFTTGKEVAKFIKFTDDEWVTLTAEGYYDSSANGHQYLNIGFDGNVYGIDQFYDVFYRPDIVQAKLRGEDISSMIGITIDDAIRNPPPAVKFTTVPANSGNAGAKVCYQAKSTGGGIGEVRLFQNGKLVKSDGFYRETVARAASEKRTLTAMNSRAIQEDLRSLAVKEKGHAGFMDVKPKGDTFEECVDLETVPGENEISVTAFNAQNSVQSYLQTATFTSTRPAEEPHLYILSVGIDKYRDKSANLKYAAKDAKDFIAKLPAKAATIYKPQNIHVVSLSDAQAGKLGILAAIEHLSKKVKQGDGFIFFNASHGVLLQNQYYIVTADFDGDLSTTKALISSNEIVEMSKRIKSLSQLFIFDTCHAGGIDNIVSGLYDARMSVMAKKMGLHIYASAGSVQTAMDGYQGTGSIPILSCRG